MHIGRKISRIRELRGMKQETLAAEMGVSQQAISKVEQSEHVDDDRLQAIAEKLGVSVEAIRNFDEEKAVNYFNTFNDSNFNGANAFFSHNTNCNFNPLDELKKAWEDNKRLIEELLRVEREKIALLERMVKGHE